MYIASKLRRSFMTPPPGTSLDPEGCCIKVIEPEVLKIVNKKVTERK